MVVDNYAIPLWLRLVRKILSVFARRRTALLTSAILLIVGYAADYVWGGSFFSSSGTLVTAIGLVMTIQPYLLTISSIEDLLLSEDSEASCGDPNDRFSNEIYIAARIAKAEDQGIGVCLIVLGTIVGALGSYITFLK